MRLHSITVRNYRRHKELRVDLDSARTLIGGPNESGKSTLVEAAHRALFLKAKGNTEIHRLMESMIHGGKPEVEVEFEAGGKRYTLHKIFKGASGTTRLTQTAGATWQGDEAEEKLAALIKIENGRKYTDPDKLNAEWSHLWVWQGKSSGDPLGSIGREHGSLVQRLQSHGGASVVQSAVDTQVSGYFAALAEAIFKQNWEPKSGSEYGQALQAESEAVEAEAQARSILQNLQHAIDQHERASAQIAEADNALNHQEAERVALNQRSAEITRLRLLEQDQLRAANEAIRLHESRLNAEQKVSELRRALASQRASLAPQNEKLGTLKQASLSARQALDETEDTLRRAEQTLQEARAQHDLAQAQANLQEKTRLQDRLQTRAKQIRDLLDQRTSIEQQAERLAKVDAAALRQLQGLERAHDKAQVMLASVATEIEVLSSPHPVQAGKETLTNGQRLTLTEETELAVGETRLRIRPGGGTSLAEARQQEQETLHQLREALGKLGVKTLAEASAAQAGREHLQTEWKTVTAELKGLDYEKLAAELTAAERELTAAKSEVERRHATGSPASLDLAATKRNLAEAETHQQTCRRQLEAQQSALKKTEAALTQQIESMRALETEITQVETRLSMLIEHEGDDHTRAQALAEAQILKTTAEAQIAATRQALAQHQPEHLEADQARFERAWKLQSDKKMQAHEMRISAIALLRSDGSSDPAAALALAEARAQMARAHREAAERHARAIKHIHDLLLEEQQTLADQFTRPLAERVTGYLQRLFGTDVQVNVTLQENQFQGLTLSRGRQGAFSFDSLSEGAREQVAAAFRLALAEILAESHDGCLPVVFDDAFAHSDPERVQNLQRMLDLAATRGLQIILLTCTPADYAQMGAHEVRLVPSFS
jgi:DNA repair exonuclease SbcCD ATPase subunit